MSPRIFILIFLLPLALRAEPVVSVDQKDIPKEMPAAENVSADPRAKVIQELGESLDEPQNIGLVLDSSGSMGQMLEKNKTKMFFLKKLMKTFVRGQWKLKNTVGVRIYGSRVKGKCDDIISPIPYSDHSLAKLEKTLEGLEPLGMTPLQTSLQMTVDEIKKRTGPKKVVIVTDGEDTCGGDPCKTAEKIKEQKLDITFYVVALGFQGPSDDIKKIACLGDDLHVANDSKSFDDAMSQISSKIQKRQNLKVISPNPDALVYLYRVEGPKRVLDRVFYAKSEQTVPPGNYEAVVGLQPLYKFETFTIPPARKVTLKVEGDGNVIVNYFGGHVRVQVLDKNNKVLMKFKSDEKVKVPSGKWKLRIYREPFFERIVTDYFVYPNGEHSFDLNSVGVLRVDAPEVEGVYVYDQDNVFIDHGLTGTPFVLKSGVYSIHVNDACSFAKVEVRDRKEVIVLPCNAEH